MMKKSFCDGWDNLFTVFVTNIITVLLGFAMALGFVKVAQTGLDLVADLILIVSCIIISIFAFAYGECAAKMAVFESIKITDFFKAIPGCIKDAVLYGLMISIVGIISFIGITYYWSEGFLEQFNLVGVFLGALLVWIDFFFIMSIQWFIPIRSLMHNNFRKCLKKSFIVFFDNTGFSIAMFLYSLVNLAISVFFIGLVPGMSGITIGLTNAMHLRLYKYDYLEEHPELQSKRQRRKIPWEELIYDDKETLGPRKLKSFLFPWKED